MMRLVLDTNVLVDALLRREPFSEAAMLILELGYLGEFELWIGTSQISDIIYIITEGGKPSFTEYAQDVLDKLCQFIHIYSTCGEDIRSIAHSTWTDLEDALVFQTALQVKAEAIVTRDANGFDKSPIPIFDPTALFEHIRTIDGIVYSTEEL